ncbi:hypothetical protein EW026_g7040 [Hermanssonia centrifuga]|uniref:Uncharacterized protein n=1 Tax=Hermanssonia centrifuga TaxID=98765 RepID=A0A4S4K9A4_9APHY|nr:hypothetical protein EW026_g7040 [Hermanssonia centrifuga]
MSILFLHKVWTMGKRARRFNLAGRVNGSKFYTLFWLASSNFVFPVLLSLAQFILLFADPAYTKETFMAILFFVNGIVEIICALLATLWVAGNRSTSSDAFEHRLSSHAKDIPQAAQDGTIMVPAMSDRQLRFSSLGPL